MSVLHTTYGDIDYQDIGSGDTTLFLMPGWCQPKTVFKNFSELAAVYFRVVTIDWRGHGESSTNGQDFDGAALLSDALTLIEHLGLTRIVPVSVAHASWISIDLVESLKNRIPAVIFLDWIMNQPEPEFFASIRDMQNEDSWQNARDDLYEYWLAESDSPVMIHHLKTEMAESSYQLWRLAGQVIADAYYKYGSPLLRLEKLRNPPQAIHIYSLDRSDKYLAIQQRFSRKHNFFEVKRLETARTHLAVLERPQDVLEEILKLL
jgi:pimeloyl-ACP methyl ester carboxylesterase